MLINCFVNRMNSSEFVGVGLLGLAILVAFQEVSLEKAGRHVTVLIKCTLTITLMHSTGSEYVNLCILPVFSKHSSVIPAISV